MRALFGELLNRFGAFITADGIEKGLGARLRGIGNKERVEEWRQCPLQAETSWWHVSAGRRNLWFLDVAGPSLILTAQKCFSATVGLFLPNQVNVSTC